MSPKVYKTRNTLIEVSRDLFAQKGKRNVTMNDIAEASGKGRRTLYTYFNNKDDIYKAVINKELEYFLSCLNKVSLEEREPDDKLRLHIITHLDVIKYLVNRNGSLSSDFFMDIYEVERARRKIDIAEVEMIRNILEQGITKRVFRRMDLDTSSLIIFHAIKGLEVPYIRKSLTNTFEVNKNEIIEYIFDGIRRPNL